MIICSCNIISDHDIREVVSTGDELCSAAQVYDCLGCTVRCGLCSHSVRQILEEHPRSAARRLGQNNRTAAYRCSQSVGLSRAVG